MPLRNWYNCGTNYFHPTMMVGWKWKTQLDCVIKQVPHALVQRIRFWRITSPEQAFKYLYCTISNIKDWLGRAGDSKGILWAFVFGFRTAQICALSQLSVCSHLPTVHSVLNCRFPCNFFPQVAPHFSGQHNSPSNLAESRYPLCVPDVIDWFWLQGWLINKGAICTGIAPLFWNFIFLFERPRRRLGKIGGQHQSIGALAVWRQNTKFKKARYSVAEDASCIGLA